MAGRPGRAGPPYGATTPANVISSTGDAALSITDPSANAPGPARQRRLRARSAPAGPAGGCFIALPTTVHGWSGKRPERNVGAPSRRRRRGRVGTRTGFPAQKASHLARRRSRRHRMLSTGDDSALSTCGRLPQTTGRVPVAAPVRRKEKRAGPRRGTRRRWSECPGCAYARRRRGGTPKRTAGRSAVGRTRARASRCPGVLESQVTGSAAGKVQRPSRISGWGWYRRTV